jgi:hypothetical protein
MSDDYPQAVVREIDGELVLDDPMALAIIQAFKGASLQKTLADNADRVAHFKRRIIERGMTLQEVCIVIINVDNSAGGPIANLLMPGTDWDAIRAQGQIPFARGLAMREGMQNALDMIDKETGTTEAGQQLRRAEGVPVIVMDHERIEVFESPLDDNNVWVKILVDPPV